MHITITKFRKRKRGVSTIMGTIIFIGIMFTSVIPMMLVMKQADNIYIRKEHEIEILDEEKERENLLVYTYTTPDLQKINVKIKNIGDVPVKIVRIWINDQCNITDDLITSNTEEVLGPFVVLGLEENYTAVITVTTERGNVFHCVSGTLYYTSGGWSSTSFGICVIVHNPKGGEYKISLWNVSRSTPQWDDFYTSKAKEWEDVVVTTPVLEASPDYRIDAKEKKGSNWKSLPGSPIDTPIEYPNGPPFIMVWLEAK